MTSMLERQVDERLSAIKADGSGYRDLNQGDKARIMDYARRVRALSLPGHSLPNQLASAAQAAVDAFDRGQL